MTSPVEPKLQVPIRPGVSVLALFKHLNYRPWYAVAEFVDNSIQSFVTHRSAISKVGDVNLRVRIEPEGSPVSKLFIRDNAAGIALEAFPRAFRPAEPPPDQTGLAEFGVGMKSAACWFASDWFVRTKALGESVERTVRFDVNRIVEDSIENLDVDVRPAPTDAHYTEIGLTRLNQPIFPKTVSRIREHIASIYRQFERSGLVELKLGDDVLRYQTPAILQAPFFKNPGAAPILWRKEVAIESIPGVRVTGWVGIRKVASTAAAGFALFRRERLIVGSGEESYRPDAIFGSPNSYTYQRLFGELEIQGVDVSHTKDGFRWEGHEEVFLESLRKKLNESSMPMLAQAEGYRVRAKTEDIATMAQHALDATASAVESFGVPVLESHSKPISNEHLPQGLVATPPTQLAGIRELKIVFHGAEWSVRIDLSNDPALGSWLTVTTPASLSVEGRHGALARRVLSIRIALAHPFMLQFGGSTAEELEPLIRVGVAIALAEVVAREAGVRNPSAVRDTINDLLRDALAKP